MIGGGATIREHIRAFADVPGVAIAGICNRTRAKAAALAKEFNIPAVADSIAELYAKTQAELAVVAVYETAINPIIKQALAQPWAILMEKPVGLDLADADDIAAAAGSARVFVGLNRRWYSATQRVLADLKDDPAPRFIHVQDQQNLEAARRAGNAEVVVRNWMFANSIHLVDYFCALGRGAITKVEPIARWNPNVPGVVLASVAFASGDSGIYEGIWHGPGPWACTVTTPRRRWEMRPLEKTVYQNAGERTLNPVEPHAWDGQFKPGFRLQAERVVAAVRGEGEAITLAEAMRSTRLVHSIFAP